MSGLMRDYEKISSDMLRRWGREVARGGSKNVLDPQTVFGGYVTGGGWPAGAAMFTPLAERCDAYLHELLLVDPEAARYLIGFALNISMQKLAEQLETNKSKVQFGLDNAMSAFAMMIYCRSAFECGAEGCPYRQQSEKKISN